MPDLKVYHPRDMFLSDDDKSLAIMSFAARVATALDCNDYIGRYIDLRPGDIDVFLIAYDNAKVRLGASLVVEVTGYDYPDRMFNIRERLTHIKDEMSQMTDGKSVSVSFIGIADGCWV